jgi:hypothetical protein
MKIIIELRDVNTHIEEKEDGDIFDMVDMIKRALLAVGFHLQSVKDAIPDCHECEENKKESNNNH